MEIVINKCFGGFGLSYKGMMEYAKQKGIQLYAFTEKLDKRGMPDFQSKEFVSYTGVGPEPYAIHYATSALDSTGHYKDYFYDGDIPRDDPALVATVRLLGSTAGGRFAELRIVEIPDGVEWEIGEYEGMESVEERHRRWR